MLILSGLGLIVLLTLATGFFVAQEFAYLAVDRHRLRLLADAGDRSAGRALRVTDRLSFTLSGSQLGITVTGLLAGYLAEPYLGRGLADLLGVVGVPVAVSLPVAVVIAVGTATIVQMVLGELAPKNLAIASPVAVARALGRPTLVYLALAGWLIRIFDVSASGLLRLIGIEPAGRLAQGATSEDLDRIIARSHAEGLLDADTYRLLDRGLGFRTLTAGEVMVPRVDVVTVPADTPAARVIDLMDTGHTRFPVVGDSVDDVLGVVSVGDIVDLDPADRAGVPAWRLASPPVLVATMLPLPKVLERLRGEHQQLACVVDEYGGLAGVITLEDIAEELVGDILDEDDLPQPGLIRQTDGSWLVPGRWRIDEIAGATGVELPTGPSYDTIAGLVMARLGRTGSVGDRAVVELPAHLDEHDEAADSGRVLLEVIRVARHVPVTVRLYPPGAKLSPLAIAGAGGPGATGGEPA